MAADGLEPLAVASYLAKIGTSDPVEPHLSLDSLAVEFDFARIGRAPAQFDPEELAALNAKLLHKLPYAMVASRLEGISEDLWEAIKPNLTRLGDAEDVARLATGPVTPVIEDCRSGRRGRGAVAARTLGRRHLGRLDQGGGCANRGQGPRGCFIRCAWR